MKVLHVIPSLSLKHGGPSVAMPEIATALTDAGIKVTIATTDDDGRGARLNVPIGNLQHNEGGTGLIYFRKNTEFYKVSLGLSRWVSDYARNFDIIHIHALFSYTSVIAARIARRCAVPYVIRPLGVLNRWGIKNRRPLLKHFSLKWIELPILKRAAAIQFTSEAEREEVNEIDPRLASIQSEVIPLPIGEDVAKGETQRLFVRFPQLQGCPIILYLSRIDKKKGLELLLQAFAIVKPKWPAVQLVIVGAGDPDYINTLQRMAQHLQIDENVIWAGYLEGEDKSAALAAATIFVLASYSENFGIAAAEALAAGVPTIVTEGVGIADEIMKAEAGLVVAPDVSDLSQAIMSLLNSQSERDRLGTRGQLLAKDRFSKQAIGAALHKLYDSILGEHPRS